jgi:hypothetical protein
MEQMQQEVTAFIDYVQREMVKEEEGWKDRVRSALVKLPPRTLVRTQRKEAS